MQDLKKKQKFREKFSVQDDWVLPFEVVPIIDIPGYGDKAAVKVSAHTSVTQFFELSLHCSAPKQLATVSNTCKHSSMQAEGGGRAVFLIEANFNTFVLIFHSTVDMIFAVAVLGLCRSVRISRFRVKTIP